MKIFRYIIISIGLFLVLFTWFFPQFFRCFFVEYDGFKEIRPHIFVESKTTKKQQDSLLRFVLQAEKRLVDFWGRKDGEAKILFCNTPQTYQKYAKTTEGAGFSIGTPLGSWIILNKDGLNTDVIAHEMCHDELMTRLGWWKTKQEIPTWFDEGLALMLDYRFVSSQDSIQRYIDYRTELSYLSPVPIPLNKLNTQKDFFGQGELYTKIAYFTSAVEVSRKISMKGKKEIFRIMNKTEKDGKFEF
ncbi:hypothetical protein Emtol_2522 [Emticicia oligotrophica DSM 17448]|uniref:Peptidase MA-like domain-containing protein n=1 Tax=Emticicia oligotrophica (strain DSM 17448 / CIP 109782 / MTCC 6937 / GPTSA100-15) TaxID=929562 RepID=A0ABN4AMT8_EMTOG|nr:hypothetical protein [Emticicia oligotrophica]AFK03658.1 hypothetical protein Emtol_2522 [Emticicia oligotrophica DSM 17448]